jgi:dTDP-4-amino-4,6-dideoxygalactose transaminase
VVVSSAILARQTWCGGTRIQLGVEGVPLCTSVTGAVAPPVLMRSAEAGSWPAWAPGPFPVCLALTRRNTEHRPSLFPPVAHEHSCRNHTVAQRAALSHCRCRWDLCCSSSRQEGLTDFPHGRRARFTGAESSDEVLDLLMSARIYLSPPDVGQSEQQAVLRALQSGWIAPLGPEVDAFEAELATATDREYAVALSSGTAALHLALLNLGVGPGDVVITATMTFAATANAVVYTGAKPVFVDCDETGNLSPELLRRAIDDQLARGSSVKAVLPVDLLGKPVDHASIGRIAADAGLPVLADSAESLGARRDFRPAGSFGTAAALSFNGNKVMTTSGGGALLTDDPEMARRARYLATQARQAVLHYEHTDIGYNYRLSNLLAALGRAQLARLPSMIERRRQHRRAYRELFADVVGAEVFGQPDGSEQDGPNRDNFWLTSILVDPQVAGWCASDLIRSLGEADIEARPLWKPMHAQPVFQGADHYLDGTSDRLYEQGVSLPSGSGMTDDQRDRVFSHISRFLREPGAR